MQRPRSLQAFMASDPAFSDGASNQTAPLGIADVDDSSGDSHGNHGATHHSGSAADDRQQHRERGGGGGASGWGARPLPVSTQTLLLPVSHLLRAASPALGAGRGSGGDDEKDKGYTAAKAGDAPLAKVLRRHWFAARRAAATGPRGAAAAAAAALLLLLLAALALARLSGGGARQAAAAGYVVFLDAGSTGTRVHIFKYRPPTGRHGGGGSSSGGEFSSSGSGGQFSGSSSGGSSSNMHGGGHLHDRPYARIDLPEPKFKVEPGLSAHAANPAGAAASLGPLLDFAREHVPPTARPSTPVRLMATAGLRLLPREHADGVLDACRAELARSGFLFRPDWAEIISGRAEGLFAWMAANYAAGALEEAAVAAAVARRSPRDWARFSGLLELGGASAQVTFLLSDREQQQQQQQSSETGVGEQQQQQQQQQQQPGESAAAGGGGGEALQQRTEPWQQPGAGKQRRKRRRHIQLRLPGLTKRLFTHSYLGYGFDVLEAKIAAAARAYEAEADPCLPRGYTAPDGRAGGGDWQECRRRVAAVMDPHGCAKRSAAAAAGGSAEGGSSSGSSPDGGGANGGSRGGAAAASCPDFPESLPPLPPTLLAIENFFYTAIALSLPPRADLASLERAGAEFCARRWEDTLTTWDAASAPLSGAAAALHARQRPYLWRYCFGSAMVATLLGDVLRVPRAQPLIFANTLPRGALPGAAAAGSSHHASSSGGGSSGGGSPEAEEVGLDWALGAALCTLMECARDGEDSSGSGGMAAAELAQALEATVAGGRRGGWLSAIAHVRFALLLAVLVAAAAAAVYAVATGRWQPFSSGSTSSGSGRAPRGSTGGGKPAGAGGAGGGGGGLPPRAATAAGLPPRGSRAGSPVQAAGGLRRHGSMSGSRRQLVLNMGFGGSDGEDSSY